MNYSAAPIEEVLKKLKTSASGLKKAEAEKRQSLYGKNEITQPRLTSFWKLFISPFNNLFAIILLIAIIVSLLTTHYFDAIVVGLVLVVDAVIEWSQRFSANNVLKALRQLDVKMALVRRNNTVQQIESTTLVPGDIVILTEGVYVPADGRIILANNLQINEAALTGESLPTDKLTKQLPAERPIYEQSNMLFKGTLVTSGRGEYCVTNIGGATEFARIAKLTNQLEEKAPIQIKIDELIKKIIIAVGGLAGLTLILALAKGYGFGEMLRFSLALSVSAIPEGLPIALSIILLLSVKKMARRKAVVKKLPTVETLGMVTLIAVDKTGTLTENRLKVSRVWALGAHSKLEEALDLSSSHKDHSSDPVNQALLRAAKPALNYKEVLDLPFSLKSKISGVVWRYRGRYEVFAKGAPEAILKHSNISAKDRVHLMSKLDKWSISGLKVLAIASKPIDRWRGKIRDVDFENMKILGLVGLADPIRPEAKPSVAIAQQAGVKVLMLTGDHRKTASTVAQTIGITKSISEVGYSEQLEQIPTEGIPAFLAKVKVLARVLPEHKFKILQGLKVARSEITAMTGDGVNDAPALVEANVGIAMGSGTDVAKEAADMVLLDDNFSTIMEAVRIGRVAYANIRKMVFYLLSTNLGEVLTIIGALLLDLPLPVTAAQILWINLVTDGAAVIPLGLEPAGSRVMHQPPRDPRAPLLDRILGVRILLVSLMMAIVTLWLFSYYQDQGLVKAQTIAFTVLVVMQWANAINARSETASVWGSWRQPNSKLFIGLGIAALLQVLILFGPFQAHFGVEPLALKDVSLLLIPVMLVLFVAEIHKLIVRKFILRKLH